MSGGPESTARLRDLQGQEAPLGRCLGRGGEGAVYSVPSRPGLVAKIYARPPDDPSSRKLGAMVQLGTEDLASFAAWPQNVLSDERTGQVVGFLMPRVERHREIHALYGPIDRKTAFPDASWAFLAKAARNVAAAFDVVHRHGHVIGDVNEGNVVVSRTAAVQLIDCDSFQITHLGRTYPCRVGVPLFTPPELQGHKLSGVTRTPDHDCFGLAVLAFHLLFMGRHPFAGRHPERALPIEAAIREGLFAFGRDAASQGWQPPPHSVRLPEVSPALARLFEQAFSRDAASGGPRPGAAEWMAALAELESFTEVCAEDPRHVRLRDASCPWCRIEREGGPSFFFLPAGSASDAFDLEATWKTIEAVRSPGPVPQPASAHPGQEMCGEEERFQARRKELENAKTALEGGREREAREWTELAERFREIGLAFHLNSFALEFARIPGLGRDELSTLALAGVTTAADLSAESLRALRGLDRALVKGLLLFKEVAARSFTFDPATGIPGRDQRLLAEGQTQRRDDLLKTLQSGAIDLTLLRRQILATRDAQERAHEEQQRLRADAAKT